VTGKPASSAVLGSRHSINLLFFELK
jgi:hypothetical protein